ncbi:MAG: hypothetical protein QOF32_36 [Gammaproteobacteria bacterium]|jgi:hypothetical protein|nr:hypothetical protein [Gammaproteobacteria bacterium]
MCRSPVLADQRPILGPEAGRSTATNSGPLASGKYPEAYDRECRQSGRQSRRELMRIGQNAPKSPLTLSATGV